MNQLDAVAVLLKHLQWITAGLCNPVAIHLNADEFRVAATHHCFKTGRVSETPELIVVVVKSEVHAGLMNLFSPDVELIGGSLVAIPREPHSLGQPRANDILDPKRLPVVALRIQSLIAAVPAGGGQAVVFNHA